ncbi:MAG: hypothetical protein ACW990_14560 [Promethearchaeota archaeon]
MSGEAISISTSELCPISTSSKNRVTTALPSSLSADESPEYGGIVGNSCDRINEKTLSPNL